MLTSYSVRFIGHLLLTFRECHGMILSEVGHDPHGPPVRPLLAGVRDFHTLVGVFG